jgi:two-component system chemotaxis sensor kinase CheA
LAPESAAPAPPAEPPGDAPAAAAPKPLLLAAVAAAPTSADGAPDTAVAALQTVRVDIRRLDNLMHLVGELGTTRNVLGRLASKLRDAAPPAALAAELEREGARLERRISMLQAQVLEARMVPLSTLFDRLVRVGTKVALELGIEAQFDTAGGQTELDKRIVEELADPLLHLVRNAIDHGLERPHLRKTTGKPAVGTVKLSAQAHGGHVVVTVQDDGGGIDAEAVAQTAIKKGLISAEGVAELSAEQRLRLILLPGFSTRDEVSAFSGRGVGLDVVKTHLERLGGGVEISTRPGGGSAFALMAPVTLAIMPALIVMAGNTPYAIPLAQVVETVGLEAAMVTPSQGLPTLQLRDRTLTLATLTELLQPSPAPAPTEPLPYAVIVGLTARQTALAVSDVLGQQDIVIKPLGPRLSHVRGLAGAAQIDDMALVLVLDVMGLTHDVRQPAPRAQEIS